MPHGTPQMRTRSLALMPVPLPMTNSVEQSELFQTMMLAARKMGKVGFGLHGTSITRVVETVPLRRLWMNPVTPPHFTPDQLAETANSLLLSGQKEPLSVVPLLDPDEPRARFGKQSDLLITNGRCRFLAAPLKSIDQLDVIVYDAPETPYHLLLDVVTRKFNNHELEENEAADWAMALVAQYRIVLEQHPAMPRLTQAKLAALVGVSQSRLNRLMRLHALPEEIIALRQAGLLDEAQAVELLPLVERDPAAAVTVAEQIAAATARGEHTTQRGARELVRTTTQSRIGTGRRKASSSGPIEFRLEDTPEDRHSLWLPDAAALPPAERIARLAHDLEHSLTHVLGAQPGREVIALLNALRAPAIAHFIQTQSGLATSEQQLV